MGPILQELSSASPLRVVMFLTALTVLPGVILSMTAFLRILIVLGFLRNAMGLNQMPPTQVLNRYQSIFDLPRDGAAIRRFL